MLLSKFHPASLGTASDPQPEKNKLLLCVRFFPLKQKKPLSLNHCQKCFLPHLGPVTVFSPHLALGGTLSSNILWDKCPSTPSLRHLAIPSSELQSIMSPFQLRLRKGLREVSCCPHTLLWHHFSEPETLFVGASEKFWECNLTLSYRVK